MKGVVIALFCAVASVSAKINEKRCPINPYIDVLLPHPNCNKFYQCAEGELLERSCPANLVFNVYKQACDYAENVDCRDKPIVPDQPDSGNGGGNYDHSLAPEICAEVNSDGILVAHEICNNFYECHNGVPVAHKCAWILLWNPSTGLCDWAENVDCGNRLHIESGNEGHDSRDSEEVSLADGGNSDPSAAFIICAVDGSDGILVAHENCHQFYICVAGLPVTLTCPLNLFFNPNKNRCDWPENVNCHRNNYHAEALKACAAEDSDSVLVAHENCNRFYICSDGLPVARDCPAGLVYNPAKDQCDWPKNVDCGSRY